MDYYTQDNTDGYTLDQLDALNDEFDRRTADEDDPDALQQISERLLADYDTGKIAIWCLCTGNDGSDESGLVGTYDDVLADICYHHDIDELPEHWTLTEA